MNLSEMRRWLDERGIQLTKSLGQNFLHDGNQIRRIVSAGDVQPNDQVLEIGPGLGPLTGALLETGATVLAIEKDRRLVGVLRERFAGTPRLEIQEADALEYLKKNPRNWNGWKLVANLPYSVGSPILVELAQAPVPPDRLVATLQWEVVQRIIAPAGSNDYGLLTLLLAAQYEAIDSFKIPSGCFFPPPDVESACVTLKKRTFPLVPTEIQSTYDRVIRVGFGQRRKILAKLLRQHWPTDKVHAALGDAEVDLLARAEKVSLSQFSIIAKRLHS